MGSAASPPTPHPWSVELRRVDLVLKVHQGLLADLQEALSRPVEVDDEREDRGQDDDQHRRAQRSCAGG